MNSYNTFAFYYDRLTENAEYEVRSEFISNFFYRYNNGNMSVLDLACGTGNITKYLSEKGYEITALDLSEEMLSVAQNKNINNAVFIKGDMTDFELPYKVDNCVCSLDSINHLSCIEDVKKCFKCVYNSLNEGGIFIFDVNTIYKHKVILADNSFIFDEEDFFLAWDNTSLDERTVQINLDFFIFNGKSYDRYSEEFTEKAYETNELVNALRETGFEVLMICNDCKEEPLNEKSERAYFICKRK
ncbi:MAG: class I SAM-dependent methyltransferase [Eubacterium sp.]|nr:class I SAM-dependent methyltransferase [Eubacterium sp.]